MKAFLLAAGEGRRLRPLTAQLPKCLVPIRGKPLLGIWLDLCRRHRIDEILVNLHSHGNQVRQFVQANQQDLKVRFFAEEKLLGSAGTVAANEEWVAGEPCFWIVYCDILTNMDLTKMLHYHHKHNAEFTMSLVPVQDPTQSGIALLDSKGVIVDFVEKPLSPKSNLAFAGIFLAGPALFEELPARVPADMGFDVFPRLIDRMHGYLVREYLTEVGTPENYRRAEQTWEGLESYKPQPPWA